MDIKHLAAIADIIQNTYTDEEAGTAALRPAASDMSDYFATQNAAFDRLQFLAACGFSSKE